MIYKIYLGLPNLQKPVILHKIINRVYLFLFKRLFHHRMIRDIEDRKRTIKLGVNNKPRSYTIDVSLTSFPARIEEVHITIETIFNQTVKADSVTLYLSKDEFKDKTLPKSLLSQQKRGLSINFVDDTLRSHTKYYYAFLNQKNHLIITFDDDSFYPDYSIEKLINAHFKNPTSIICNRGHKINVKNEKFQSYAKWSHNYKFITPCFDIMPTGVGGVLYPPGSVHSDIFDSDLFKKKCFYADDVWLKIHSLRNNTRVVSLKTFSRDFINVGQSQKVKLVNENVNSGGNDVQFNNLISYYNLTVNNFRDGM